MTDKQLLIFFYIYIYLNKRQQIYKCLISPNTAEVHYY